jgi:hypothetical protein
LGKLKLENYNYAKKLGKSKSTSKRGRKGTEPCTMLGQNTENPSCVRENPKPHAPFRQTH